VESEPPPCPPGKLEAGEPVGGGAPSTKEVGGQGEMEPAAGGAGGAAWYRGDTSGLRWVSVRRARRGLAVAPAAYGRWACGECHWGRRVGKVAVEIRERVREK
jgi:hypothetical protein